MREQHVGGGSTETKCAWRGNNETHISLLDAYLVLVVNLTGPGFNQEANIWPRLWRTFSSGKIYSMWVTPSGGNRDIKRPKGKGFAFAHPPSVWQFFYLVGKFIYTAATTAATTIFLCWCQNPTSSSFQWTVIWTEDQWLSRNPPGLQYQTGTAAASSFMVSASLGWWQSLLDCPDWTM